MQHYNNYYLYRGFLSKLNHHVYDILTCLVVKLNLEPELDLFTKLMNIKQVIFLIELELFD